MKKKSNHLDWTDDWGNPFDFEHDDSAKSTKIMNFWHEHDRKKDGGSFKGIYTGGSMGKVAAKINLKVRPGIRMEIPKVPKPKKPKLPKNKVVTASMRKEALRVPMSSKTRMNRALAYNHPDYLVPEKNIDVKGKIQSARNAINAPERAIRSGAKKFKETFTSKGRMDKAVRKSEAKPIKPKKGPSTSKSRGALAKYGPAAALGVAGVGAGVGAMHLMSKRKKKKEEDARNSQSR